MILIGGDFSISDFNAPGGDRSDFRVMRNQNDRAALLAQFSEKPQNIFSGNSIQVTGGFIRKNNSRLIDESPSNGHPLLLTSG